MLEADAVQQSDGSPRAALRVPGDREKVAQRHRTSGIRARLANQALDHLPLAVAVVDHALRLQYWNLHAAGLFGMAATMAADTPPLAQALEASGRITSRQADRVIDFCSGIIAQEERFESPSWLRLSLSRQQRVAVKLQGLGGGRWMLLFESLNALAQPVRGRRDAMLDALTGLSNRRHFNDMLGDMVGHAEPGTSHAVMLIDLDQFNTVNSGPGHAIGDAVLSLVGQRLRRQTRDEDVVARLGGDDFAILLPDGESAEGLAGRVLEVLSRPFGVEGHSITLSASVGIAGYGDHATTAEDLLCHAHLALCEAKRSGGGAWRNFEPAMAERAGLRRDLEVDLRQALALGEFSMVYQPQLDIRGDRLTGFAALPRWQHAKRGDVPAEVYLPVIEAIGGIQGFVDWLMLAACTQAAAWPDALSVVVNLAPSQLADCDGLLKSIESALRKSGLAAGRLEIEIGESLGAARHAPVLDLLARLRGLGISTALDDLGVAASPNPLRSFPFDKVKIDRSFIASLTPDGQTTAVIRALTGFGSAAGMMTMTGDNAAAAPPDRVVDIQGYLISRPVPAGEIDSLVRQFVTGRPMS